LLYARRQPLERPVAFKVNSLLAALGRNGGGQDHEQLQRELLRLQNGSVHIIVGKRSKNFSGAFLKTFYRDRKTQTWNVIFDAQLLSLYEEGYTYVNWKERRSLGKNSLAKWLHGFYASHANPFPYKVTTLKRLCGSATNRVCDFRKTLKGALTALEKIGAIVEWRIDEKTDLVTVTNRKKSRLSSQDLKNHFAQAAASAVNIREVATTSKPLLQEIIPTHTHASTLAASADTVATSLPFDEWTLDALRALEWKRFELLCAKYYETLGFKPKTVEFGPDDGIDIKLFRAEEIKPVCIVQCKAWNHWAVGVAPVRELLGVMTSENVAHGVFLTTSSFTKEAAAFATKNSIHILDGLLLIKKLRALANAPRTQLLEFAFAGDYATPTCPSCGAKMVTNKESANGVAWRCSGYPRCRSFFTLNGKALGRP
jgi:restriction endonuclease Mrr